MHIHRITSGKVEPLKDWDSWFSVVDEDEDYYVAFTVGSKEEEIVITLDPDEYEDFKRTLMFTRKQLIEKIKAKMKLKRAAEKEFRE